MKRYVDFLARLNGERELAYDMLRVYLGVALFVRGALFVVNADPLRNLGLHLGADGTMLQVMVSHYVVPAHMMGGVLLVFGLLTRLAAVAQVPALLGAVFLVHWNEGLLTAGQGLELSILTLFLLLLFAVFGPGHMSLDARLFPRQVEPGMQRHAHAHP